LNVRDRSIPIIGQIDRIDKLDKEDKYIAIDYKSSSGGVKSIDDMESGLSLQLPVYILSQEGRDMVAGAYSIINNAKTEIKLGLKPFIRGRGKSILTQEEWDRLMLITKENIYNILSNIEKGDFRVEPQECSPYCIYKDICRYRDVLEVE
jgi:ATP-dependent helicase/nuclease subunit B